MRMSPRRIVLTYWPPPREGVALARGEGCFFVCENEGVLEDERERDSSLEISPEEFRGLRDLDDEHMMILL